MPPFLNFQTAVRPSLPLPRTIPLYLLVLFAMLIPLLRGADAQAKLPACEWCGATETPADASWSTTTAGHDEPGERLVISGTAYQADGTTPAPSVILYVYHANAEGLYPRRGTETGNGRRHGYLRGWVRTSERGRYRVETTQPGTYPTRTEPARIRVTVKEPGV